MNETLNFLFIFNPRNYTVDWSKDFELFGISEQFKVLSILPDRTIILHDSL